MSGSLLAMPMLVINMGGEMVYILEQRLRAQNIPTDKSRKGECCVAFLCCGIPARVRVVRGSHRQCRPVAAA